MEAVAADLRGEHWDEVLDRCIVELRSNRSDERSCRRRSASIDVGDKIFDDRLESFIHCIHDDNRTAHDGQRCKGGRIRRRDQ